MSPSRAWLCSAKGAGSVPHQQHLCLKNSGKEWSNVWDQQTEFRNFIYWSAGLKNSPFPPLSNISLIISPWNVLNGEGFCYFWRHHQGRLALWEGTSSLGWAQGLGWGWEISRALCRKPHLKLMLFGFFSFFILYSLYSSHLYLQLCSLLY